MDCHMQSLNEKLRKLEKILPQNGDIELCRNMFGTDNSINGNEAYEDGICPVNDLINKEKCLCDTTYNVNNPLITNVTTTILPNENKNSTDECYIFTNKKRQFVKKARLSLLEDYSNKLCNNLQCLRKNQLELIKETQHLSQVLNKTQKYSEVQKKNQDSLYSNEFINQSVKNYGHFHDQRDNCIACDTVEWHQLNENINYEEQNKNCDSTKKKLLNIDKCMCHEISSASDSDESCECHYVQEEKINNDSNYACKDADSYSASSNCSSDKTMSLKKKPRYTRFYTKNKSHKDLSLDSDQSGHIEQEFTKNMSTKKYQRHFTTSDTKENFLSVENNSKLQNKYPIFQDTILNRLKLINIKEVKEDLQRLKIQNDNLKDFLYTLENPINFMNETSEISSLCTTVSSCYTLDLYNQTHTSLVTVVKVLESKCRNKDIIIAALADELRMIGNAKMRFKSNKSDNKKMENSKNLNKNEEIKKKFITKDSVVGFLFLTMILASHIKTPEVIFYFEEAKKNLSKYTFYSVKLIKEIDKLFPHFMRIYYQKFNRITIFTWKNIYKWLDKYFKLFYMEINKIMSFTSIFVIENQSYVAFTSSVIFSTILFIKLRKAMIINLKNSKSIELDSILNLYKSIKFITLTFLKVFFYILSSRIFWLILGYCSHIIWDLIQADVIKLIEIIINYYNEKMRISSEENVLKQVITDEPVDQSLKYLNYSQFISMFRVKFQNFIELFYHAVVNVIV